MTHIAVQPQALRGHSDYLGELAGKISSAAEKGAGVSFGPDTFGLVGQAFALQARQTSQQAAEQIRAFSGSTTELGDAVGQCVETYAADDQHQAECLAKIEW